MSECQLLYRISAPLGVLASVGVFTCVGCYSMLGHEVLSHCQRAKDVNRVSYNPGMTVFSQFFGKMYFKYVSRGCKKIWSTPDNKRDGV